MSIRVAIIDECDLTVLGACVVLGEDHRFKLIGSGSSLVDLLRMSRDTSPDIILLNEWFPNTDVLSAVEEVQTAVPLARIIVTGTLTEGLFIRDLFAAGVKAYLYKRDPLREVLITAVDTVMANRPYLSPTANSEYLFAMQSPLRDWKLDAETRQILRLLAKGLHVTDIAMQLDVPVRRIYWVRQKLRKRFGANTNEHLISLSVAEGFAYTDY